MLKGLLHAHAFSGKLLLGFQFHYVKKRAPMILNVAQLQRFVLSGLNVLNIHRRNPRNLY